MAGGHGHDDGRMEVVVIVRADMPETAAGTNVVVRVPMPRNAVSVHSDVRTARRHGAECIDCLTFVPLMEKKQEWW